MKKYIVVLWLSAALILPPISTFAAEKNSKCLEYEPETVRVSGVIRPQTFAGPPEFSSVKEGDEPLLYWILHLDAPICVNGKDGDPINEEEHDIRVILLVANYVEDMYERYKNLPSKEVTVTGELYHAHTAWHKTRVLIQVKSIKPTNIK